MASAENVYDIFKRFTSNGSIVRVTSKYVLTTEQPCNRILIVWKKNIL